MTENKSYGYIQDQGQCHLGHLTPCSTRLVIVDKGFSIEIAISLQIREFQLKNRFKPVVTLSKVQNTAVSVSVGFQEKNCGFGF